MNLIKPEELADRLGVPQRTLDNWVTLGKGPKYLRAGRYRRYRPEDVDAWIDSQVRGGDAA